MRFRKGRCNLRAYLYCLRGFHRVPRDPVPEGDTVNKFSGDKIDGINLPDLVDGQDVWVI